MRRLVLLLLPLLLCGCAKAPSLPAIATPGPETGTQIQGFFRLAGEAAEVVELDAEHGHWAYRADDFGVLIESYEGDYEAGTAAWCMAELMWKGDEPRKESAGADDCVLFLPQTEPCVLVEDGESAADDGARQQRAGWGSLPDGGAVVIALTGKYEGTSVGLTKAEFAALFIDAGCVSAMQTAEGAAAALYFMGKPINDPIDGARPAIAAPGVGWGTRSAVS